MLNKESILNRYSSKEDKIFASNIIDKIRKFENIDKVIFTNFLNLNEFRIAIELLNASKTNYFAFDLNGMLERKVIFFIPSYLESDDKSFLSNIKCYKITNLSKEKLLHKNYMGAIYNLGIDESCIGDIIVSDNYAICFVLSKAGRFFEYNLDSAGKAKVKVEEIAIDNISTALEIKYDYAKITVNSNRADIILAHLYNLSRNETFEKIVKGDLIINGKENKNPSETLRENDIISFRKCGKFKYVSIDRITKSDKIVINIAKYA